MTGARQASRIRLAAALTGAFSGLAASIVSWPSAAALARMIGEPAAVAWLYPVAAAGLTLAAGFVLLYEALAGRRGPVPAWAALAAGTAFAVWAIAAGWAW